MHTNSQTNRRPLLQETVLLDGQAAGQVLDATASAALAQGATATASRDAISEAADLTPTAGTSNTSADFGGYAQLSSHSGQQVIVSLASC